jgi:DNA repair protein RadC
MVEAAAVAGRLHSSTPIAETGPQKIPTRFGQELSECTGVEDALALTRKRLPRLKPILACRFLSMIGYPIAVPLPDVVRLCRDLGMLSFSGENANSGDSRAQSAGQVTADSVALTTILQRASRLTCTPLAQLAYLLAIFSGAVRVPDYRAACGRSRPACDTCRVTTHCDRRRRDQLNAPARDNNGGAPAARRQSIKEWAADERPRERMLAGERLSNAELLGLILRTGTGSLSAVELGRRLINAFGTLHELDRATPGDIISKMKGSGIGPAKAAEICAAIELGRRVTQPAADTRGGLRRILTSRDIFEKFRVQFKAALQEEFYVLILNAKHLVQREVRVSLGTLNASLVHPREAFSAAIREGAFAVIFLHNHPSGDPTPSEQDILLTARLIDAGKLLGIQVIDHVIIGSHEWYSFADHGRMR